MINYLSWFCLAGCSASFAWIILTWLYLSRGPIGARRSKMSSVVCLGPWYSWLESWDVSLSFCMVSYHFVIRLKLLYVLPCSKMVGMETVWSLKAYALEFPHVISSTFYWLEKVTRAVQIQGKNRFYCLIGRAEASRCKGLWIERVMIHWGLLF